MKHITRKNLVSKKESSRHERTRSKVLKEFPKSKYDTVQDCKDAIQNCIDHCGEYAHNIVSCTLRIVEEKFGREQANKIVREMELKKLFGIHEENES